MNQTKNYLAFLLILIAITVAGYFGFLKYARNISALNLLPLSFLAVFAGIATFFSPCSFGLLPAYLSIYAKGKFKGDIVFKNGIVASAGLITFNIVLGVVLALIGLGIGSAFSVAAGGKLAGITLTIRAAVGVILFILGLFQFFHISIQAALFQSISRKLISKEKGVLNFYLYGFGYNLGNIGCTGPIMAGLIILALASGFNAALFAFIIYSLTMGLLMLLVSLLVGTAKIEFLKETSPHIMRIAAIVLMLAGLFIIGTVVYANQFAVVFFPD